MAVKQLAVNMDNTPGKLSIVSDILGKEGVNIGAIMISESTDSSVVRIICTDPDKAFQVLKSKGFTVRVREVIAVQTPDHPGGLNAILKPLAQAGINVDYIYSYLKRINDEAILIFGVADLQKAVEILKENWIQILDEEIYSL
ncbi:MAG: ACT domain-containing protein [bacterium]